MPPLFAVLAAELKPHPGFLSPVSFLTSPSTHCISCGSAAVLAWMLHLMMHTVTAYCYILMLYIVLLYFCTC